MSNEQIVRTATAALKATGYRQLESLQVYCSHGRLTLQGRVPTYYLKQVAQSAIQGLHGIRDIDNDIRVRSGSSHSVASSID